MIRALAFAVGYLLGSIPFGLILTRAAGGPDVRTIGSGNIGATNVLRTGQEGPRRRDLAVRRAQGHRRGACSPRIMRRPMRRSSPALGAFLGHLFPVWLKFKGGKGVAIYIGLLIGLYWPGALIFCAIWLGVAALSRYSSLAALDRQRADAAGAVAARPAERRRTVPAAQRAAVDHAPRQYRAPPRRQRKQDRQ